MAVRRNGHARTPARQPDLGKSAGHVVDSLKELGGEARALADKQVADVRDTAVGYWEDGRERAADWHAALEEMIREKPAKSLAIAVGAGFALGFLFRGRR